VISSRAYHDHRPDLILAPVTSQIRNPPALAKRCSPIGAKQAF